MSVKKIYFELTEASINSLKLFIHDVSTSVSIEFKSYTKKRKSKYTYKDIENNIEVLSILDEGISTEEELSHQLYEYAVKLSDNFEYEYLFDTFSDRKKHSALIYLDKS